MDHQRRLRRLVTLTAIVAVILATPTAANARPDTRPSITAIDGHAVTDLVATHPKTVTVDTGVPAGDGTVHVTVTYTHLDEPEPWTETAADVPARTVEMSAPPWQRNGPVTATVTVTNNDPFRFSDPSRYCNPNPCQTTTTTQWAVNEPPATPTINASETNGTVTITWATGPEDDLHDITLTRTTATPTSTDTDTDTGTGTGTTVLVQDGDRTGAVDDRPGPGTHRYTATVTRNDHSGNNTFTARRSTTITIEEPPGGHDTTTDDLDNPEDASGGHDDDPEDSGAGMPAGTTTDGPAATGARPPTPATPTAPQRPPLPTTPTVPTRPSARQPDTAQQSTTATTIDDGYRDHLPYETTTTSTTKPPAQLANEPTSVISIPAPNINPISYIAAGAIIALLAGHLRYLLVLSRRFP